MADARFQTQCDQCEQVDDHPKWSDGTVQKHHDCLSGAEKRYVASTSPRANEIIQACVGGLHGDELLAFIQQDQHLSPALEEVQ